MEDLQCADSVKITRPHGEKIKKRCLINVIFRPQRGPERVVPWSHGKPRLRNPNAVRCPLLELHQPIRTLPPPARTTTRVSAQALAFASYRDTLMVDTCWIAID